MTKCELCPSIDTRHRIIQDGEEKRYCCKCYVLKLNNSPSDWHHECMQAYKERRL